MATTGTAGSDTHPPAPLLQLKPPGVQCTIRAYLEMKSGRVSPLPDGDGDAGIAARRRRNGSGGAKSSGSGSSDDDEALRLTSKAESDKKLAYGSLG